MGFFTQESALLLLDHPQLWPEMGRVGRRFVEEHYDIKKLNRRLVEIYDDLVQGKLSNPKAEIRCQESV